MNEFYLSFGGNIDDTMSFFKKAILELDALTKEKIIVSPVYRSKSWGFEAQQDFLNCCVKVSSVLEPLSFLLELKKIEQNAGRTKKSTENGYASRVLDIDIIYCDSLIIMEEGLVIPHPERLNRNFVLYPLADIASSFVDPIVCKTVKELKDLCKDEVEVVKVGEFV